MNYIIKNRGVIIFYLVIIVASLILIEDVKRDNERENNRYVMVYMAN